MGIFSTEFPVKSTITKEAFFAASISWLRGMTYSKLDFDQGRVESYRDEIIVNSDEGEKFSYKYLDVGAGFVAGSRHDVQDASNLTYRTELVLTNLEGRASIRARSQCFSSAKGIPVKDPKRPFFIKSFLQDGWGGQDDIFLVSDKPIILSSDQCSLAAKLILGDFYSTLPVVYISCADGTALLDSNKLAYDLGGLAHVVVEPSVKFSLAVTTLADRRNPYSGTIGVYEACDGKAVKFYLGGAIDTNRKLELAIRNYVTRRVSVREAMLGWEWQELHSQFSRKLRHKASQEEQARTSDWEVLLFDEIATKDETIQNLKQRIEMLSNSASEYGYTDGLLAPALVRQIGEEIFDNEFSDRILLFMQRALAAGDFGLGDRTLQVVERLLRVASKSNRVVAFHQELKAAGRDARQSTSALSAILERIGYIKPSSFNHPKYVPGPSNFGFGQVTLPSTPSDGRSGRNGVRDIVKALDLKDLKETDDD